MHKHDVDDWILDETELAEHYKGIGKPEGYDSKMELVGLLKQLKEYQQLEGQGRLVKLPCKVGDTVYIKLASYCEEKYAEAKVRDFTHFISCGFCVVVTSEHFDKQNIPFTEFGKTVFLTNPQQKSN